jgi:hypothetical protein
MIVRGYGVTTDFRAAGSRAGRRPVTEHEQAGAVSIVGAAVVVLAYSVMVRSATSSQRGPRTTQKAVTAPRSRHRP